MTAKRLFYRYRATWAWGVSDWEYHDIVIPEDDWPNWEKEEIVPRIHREHDYSDKYRGVNIERVETPPLDWLEEQATQSDQAAKYHTERAKELRALAKQGDDGGTVGSGQR